MHKFTYLLILALVLISCTPQPSAPASTATPAQTPLVGTVDIQTPQTGAVIYSEVLYVAGTASDIPAEGFKIQLFDLDETLMVETIVQPEGESWVVEITHGYSGDPIEVSLLATAIDAQPGQEYDAEAVVLSAVSNRPQGTFGSITSPTEGSTVGGDQILVFGTGSGLFENTLIVQLRQPDGAVIDEKILTINNPYFVDEVIWSTEMMTNGYTGFAELVALYYSAQDGSEVIISRIGITIAGAAG